MSRLVITLVMCLLTGCSAEIVIIPPPTMQIAVSQGLAPLQQSGPELSRPKPKTRSIGVKQTIPGLGQKATGLVPGEFSQEYSDEFK